MLVLSLLLCSSSNPGKRACRSFLNFLSNISAARFNFEGRRKTPCLPCTHKQRMKRKKFLIFLSFFAMKDEGEGGGDSRRKKKEIGEILFPHPPFPLFLIRFTQKRRNVKHSSPFFCPPLDEYFTRTGICGMCNLGTSYEEKVLFVLCVHP